MQIVRILRCFLNIQAVSEAVKNTGGLLTKE